MNDHGRRQTLGFCLFDTAIGPCAVAWGEGVLTGVQLPESTPERLRLRMRSRFPDAQELREGQPPDFVRQAMERTRAVLDGAKDDLQDVPLDLDAVAPFHRRVYEIARAIPPGRTMTYGEVARAIGEPGASRAVGQALGLNPFAPVVPCHRVLAAGGRSGGFSAEGGAATKLRMLEIEQARFGSEPGLFDGS
ncbi:MAG: methylated-DNA--[protein]-cysteine S-methyltransferase [Pseudomonadota bacterium]